MKTICLILISFLLTACGGSENKLFSYYDEYRTPIYQERINNYVYVHEIYFDLVEKPLSVSYHIETILEFYIHGSENYVQHLTSDPVEVRYNKGYSITELIYDRSFQAQIWQVSIIIDIEYMDRNEQHIITEYGGN